MGGHDIEIVEVAGAPAALWDVDARVIVLPAGLKPAESRDLLLDVLGRASVPKALRSG
jgi:hypothetical protein